MTWYHTSMWVFLKIRSRECLHGKVCQYVLVPETVFSTNEAANSLAAKVSGMYSEAWAELWCDGAVVRRANISMYMYYDKLGLFFFILLLFLEDKAVKITRYVYLSTCYRRRFFLLKYLIKMFYLRLKWETQSLSSLRVKANVFVIHVNVHVR